MKVGALIPTQGNRPNFLAQCVQYVARQSYPIHTIEIVNDDSGMKIDLTWRYKLGFERLKNKCDLIVVFEDDDWYSKDYVESIVDRIGDHEIVGSNQTYYYHIMHGKLWQMKHPGRASMFSTAIKTDALDKIDFPDDNFVYLDMWLWKQLKGLAYDTSEIHNVGIKHALGLCGGIGHSHLNKYIDAPNWLKIIVGSDYEFYERIARDGTP
jgi:glycosyltransferase involved in cell wall biosynthesis